MSKLKEIGFGGTVAAGDIMTDANVGANLAGNAAASAATYQNTPALLTDMFGRFAVGLAETKYVAHTETVVKAEAWIDFYIRMPATINDFLFLCHMGQGTNRAADVRLNSDRTISVRDFNSARWTSPVYPAGSIVQVTLRSKPGQTLSLELRSGTRLNKATADVGGTSGDLPNTTTVATGLLNYRFGVVLSSSNGGNVIDMDNITIWDSAPTRDADTPPPSDTFAVTPAVNYVVEPVETTGARKVAQLSATANRTGATFRWRQISPTTPSKQLALSSSTVRQPTFTVPQIRAAEQYTFGVIATVAGTDSPEAQQVVTVSPTTEWAVRGGVQVPRRRVRVSS